MMRIRSDDYKPIFTLMYLLIESIEDAIEHNYAYQFKYKNHYDNFRRDLIVRKVTIDIENLTELVQVIAGNVNLLMNVVRVLNSYNRLDLISHIDLTY